MFLDGLVSVEAKFKRHLYWESTRGSNTGLDDQYCIPVISAVFLVGPRVSIHDAGVRPHLHLSSWIGLHAPHQHSRHISLIPYIHHSPCRAQQKTEKRGALPMPNRLSKLLRQVAPLGSSEERC